MGAVWLASLPAVLESAGLQVTRWPGWELRSRSSGGYDAVWAIGVHHDAAPVGTSLETRCRYAWEQSSTRPIGALWLHTDGRVVVGAAGATNTQGRGGPVTTSKGVIPLDAGNRYMLSIEASNNGSGEVWPEAQQEAYVLLCRTLCDWLDLNPEMDVIAHFEYTSRKIDPAGPSRYAAGVNKWNMDAFRADVAYTPPVPIPTPTGDADMLKIDLRTPTWTSMLIGPTTITHIVDGFHAEVLVKGGVSQTDVTKRQVLGCLAALRATNASPFAPGKPGADAELHAAWEQARIRPA